MKHVVIISAIIILVLFTNSYRVDSGLSTPEIKVHRNLLGFGNELTLTGAQGQLLRVSADFYRYYPRDDGSKNVKVTLTFAGYCKLVYDSQYDLLVGPNQDLLGDMVKEEKIGSLSVMTKTSNMGTKSLCFDGSARFDFTGYSGDSGFSDLRGTARVIKVKAGG